MTNQLSCFKLNLVPRHLLRFGRVRDGAANTRLGGSDYYPRFVPIKDRKIERDQQIVYQNRIRARGIRPRRMRSRSKQTMTIGEDRPIMVVSLLPPMYFELGIYVYYAFILVGHEFSWKKIG